MELKKPIKWKIDKAVLDYYYKHSAVFQLSEDYPKYLFNHFLFKVHSDEDLNNGIAEIINLNSEPKDEAHNELLDMIKELLPKQESEDNDKLNEIIEELDDMLFNKCSEIVSTPFFMFKRVVRLKADIKQLKSVISLIRRYL